MTFEIVLVLTILVAALVLFITEWLRMDLVALLVLCALALSGVIDTREALSGFSSPAVITVWAMFILSSGLTRSGVAALIGTRVLGLAGTGETRLVAVIMLTAATMSVFMNSIGVAALMMPVVLDVGRRTGTSPSRLLMPLAFGTLLGGLTTLLTTPNLLVSELLADHGFVPFGILDFASVGFAPMLAGVLFIAFLGRRWLPRRDPSAEAAAPRARLAERVRLEEHAAMLRLPEGSPLIGRTLAQSRIGQATGLNVFAVARDGRTELMPGSNTVLRAGDRMLVTGELKRFLDLREWRGLEVEQGAADLSRLINSEIGLVELAVADDSPLIGQTVRRLGFRRQFGGVVLALSRDGRHVDADVGTIPLRGRDVLLVQGRKDDLAALHDRREFAGLEEIGETRVASGYRLREQLFCIHVPEGSRLAGRALSESRIGEVLGLGVVGFRRGEETHLMPDGGTTLEAGDVLLMRGNPDDLATFAGMQGLVIEEQRAPTPGTLENDHVGLVDAMLSPTTRIAGSTLGELRFRERFGFLVLAILREGEVLRNELGDQPLRFGDALLLLGPRDRVRLLEQEPDILVLSGGGAVVVDRRKAPLATLIMAAVLVPVLLGALPIAIAAVAGAAMMVVTRCLSMEEAHRAIQWPSVFLIAGMLPLGTALQESGAASLAADGLVAVVDRLGPFGAVALLYGITAACTSVLPSAALVVLAAPIALRLCAETGISEQSVMMAVAIAASASFTSPIAHPANALVMGPGGYRFVHFLKVGLPLTLIVMAVVLAVLPFAWPLR